MSIIHDPALHELRQQLRGYVYDPGEPEYDEARTLFNARIERRPRHVVRASRPHHVAAALEYAALRDLPVAVRAGGHSVAGLSLVDDGIVIDVRGFREITVDPERRVVRAGAGLTWGELDAATQEHGLATVGGRVSSTGVAGLALGGGSGWLERKYGLAVDNMLAVELVTARGDEVRASADEHPGAVLGAARRRRQLRRRDGDRVRAAPGRARGARRACCSTRPSAGASCCGRSATSCPTRPTSSRSRSRT